MKSENCWKPSDEDFIALATGELSFWKSPRLRRHIAVCPDCAAASAQITSVLQQAGVERLTSADNSLRERLWASFAPTPEPSRRAAPFLSRRAALGGIAAAVAASAVVSIFLPGTLGRPAVAFAQVEKAMSDIRTVTWRSQVIKTVRLEPKGKYTAYQPKGDGVHWARLEPPTLVSGGGKHRTIATATESYAVDEEESGFVYYGHSNFGIRASLASGPEKDKSPRERLLSAILFPKTEEGATEWKDKGLEIRRTPWRTIRDSLDGKSVLRFEGELLYTQNISNGSDFGWQETGTKRTIWVDPQTYRIIKRMERLTFFNGRETVESIVVSDSFRYNLTPPTGIFDYLPTVGTRYEFRAFSERRAMEDEGTAIRAVLRRAADAVNRRDATAYANQWDFDYLNVAAERRAWEKRQQLRKMASVKITRPWRVDKMKKSVTRPTGIFVQETPETPFPPPQPNEFKAVAQMVDATGKVCVWNVNLRKEGGDFRIIRAEFYPIPK